MGVMMLRRGDSEVERTSIRKTLAEAARIFIGEWDEDCGGDEFTDRVGTLYWTPGNGDARLTTEVIEDIGQFLGPTCDVWDVTAGIPDRFVKVVQKSRLTDSEE